MDDAPANTDDPPAVFTTDPPPPARLSAAPVAGLLCFRCGYDLRATDSDDLCPECGLPVATSVSSSMLAAEGVTHGPGLRTGLVLLAVSLYMIPVIPWVALGVGLGTSFRGFATTLAVLVGVEHGLWLPGIWRVCGFAATQPDKRGGRRTAAVARVGAALCAAAAVITVVLGVVAVYDGGGADIEAMIGLMVVTTTVMLIARVVSLLAGARAAGLALRTLRCGGTTTALRLTAILGTVASGFVALGTAGLGLLIPGRGFGTRDTGDLAAASGYLLIVAVPCVWGVGLAGGIVCTVAATKVNNRLRQFRAG